MSGQQRADLAKPCPPLRASPASAPPLFPPRARARRTKSRVLLTRFTARVLIQPMYRPDFINLHAQGGDARLRRVRAGANK